MTEREGDVDPHPEDVLDPVAFANLFERSAVPTLVVDHERRQILQANRAALAMVGLEPSAVLGRPATDFLLELSTESQNRIQALRGDETAALRQIAAPGGVRTVELNIVASGTDGIVLVEMYDVSALLEAAVRVEAAEEELASTSTALRTVAARLAHDLRGPLTAISGFADLLLGESPALDAAQRVRVLERISANTAALATMIDSILGEADSGAPRPEDSSRAVEDLFRSVRAVTDAQLAAAGGELRTEAAVATLPVPVGRVRQAVVNLVSNSIKYRDPSRPLVVELLVRPDDGGTAVAVRDNGRGLPHDTAALFDAGTRGASAEGTTGAGLGLAFARAAVESVKGRISARPLDGGAELTIVLPHLEDSGGTAPDVAEHGPPVLTGAQLGRIVDAAPVATFVIDIAARQVVSVNRASVDLLGVDAADVLGRPAAELLDEQEIADGLRRRIMAEPGARHPLRARLRTSGGEVPALVWITVVEGTALAVAQAVPLAELAALDATASGERDERG